MTLRRIWKIIHLVGGAGAFAILAVTIRNAWIEVASSGLAIEWSRAVFGTILGSIGYFLSVVTWLVLLRELGAQISLRQFFPVCVLANLGRYLPGKVWQIVGMVSLGKEVGVAPAVSAASSFLFLGFYVSCGALVGSLLMPPGLLPRELASFVWLIAAAPTPLLIQPRLLTWLTSRTPESFGLRRIPPISRRGVLAQVLLQVGTWTFHGFAYFVFVTALGHLSWDDYPLVCGSYVLAYVTGLIAVFAPGGIGIREGLLGFLLGEGHLGGAPVHVAAVAARVFFVAYELIVVMVAVYLRWASRSRQEPPPSSGSLSA